MLANVSRNGYRHVSEFRQSFDALSKYFDNGILELQSLLFFAMTNTHSLQARKALKLDLAQSESLEITKTNPSIEQLNYSIYSDAHQFQ